MSAHNPLPLVEHLFRHEYGRIVAVLTRVFGTHNLSMAEDVVQDAFLQAAQSWRYSEVPNNPSGWLMRVAKNKAIDILRRQRYQQQYSQEVNSHIEAATEQAVEHFFLDTEIADSQLRMIFACCHPSLKEEDQIALTLKTISGFSAGEIARALLTNEVTVQKRLYRAKQFLRDNQIKLEIPIGPALKERLTIVYAILYLLFNEGYNSGKQDELIRHDLCAEAMRLCLLLSTHATGHQPATFALLSLMCLQASRFESRLGHDHTIILLQHQDRSTWNKELIQRGYYYLNQSSAGKELTIYHVESAIAAEHCMAASFEETNWQRMLYLYDLLLNIKHAAIVQLNRAIVVAQLQQPLQAIQEIWDIDNIEHLIATQYLFSAVLGDLYMRTGDTCQARRFLQQAFTLTTSQAEKNLIQEKVKTLEQLPLN